MGNFDADTEQTEEAHRQQPEFEGEPICATTVFTTLYQSLNPALDSMWGFKSRVI